MISNPNQAVDGKELQTEANILCAFCFIFGLRLNSTKTEMFIQNYGGEKDLKDQTHIELKVMDEIKKEIIIMCIPLQRTGKDKHLGIIHDNKRNGTETLKEEIKSLLVEDCNKVISRKYHRTGDKINCINTMIIPRATYKLRNSALSNDEMIHLEKIE
jgi:hypothetical protein